MTTQPQLETYLNALDKALGAIPVSDRSDIITEIKSHILSAQERNPEQNLNAILQSIGEPENVANRYLLERGLKPGRPAKSPMIKWVTIGLLGTLGMIFLFFTVLLWKFTPIISVDEKAGKVQILGGAISINSDDIRGSGSRIFQFKTNGMNHDFSGKQRIDLKETRLFSVPFNSGKFDLRYHADSDLLWSCKTAGQLKDFIPTTKDGVLTLDFSAANGVKCDLTIPAGLKLAMKGDNAKMSLEDPAASVELRLNNGKIGIKPSKEKQYRYDLKVHNGKIDSFPSSQKKDALLIDIQLDNGVISNDEN